MSEWEQWFENHKHYTPNNKFIRDDRAVSDYWEQMYQAFKDRLLHEFAVHMHNEMNPNERIQEDG